MLLKALGAAATKSEARDAEEELKRLLAAAKEVDGQSLTSGKDSASPLNEWHLLILIGIYTGLRLGDCCRLDWSQISIAQGVIQLVPRKTRRHHQRMVTIPIHPALGAALVEREVKAKGEGEQWNCSSSFLGPVLPMIAEMYERSRWRVCHELTRIFKQAGIPTSVRIEGRHRRTPEATSGLLLLLGVAGLALRRRRA